MGMHKLKFLIQVPYWPLEVLPIYAPNLKWQRSFFPIVWKTGFNYFYLC